MTDCECGDSFIEEFNGSIWVLRCDCCGLVRPMTEQEMIKYAEEWYTPYEADVDGGKG